MQKIATLILICFTLNAIGQHRCGTDQSMINQFGSKQAVDQHLNQVFDQIMQAEEALHQSNKAAAAYTIPVVVHVIHMGENIGCGSNISMEQIQSQIDVLNEDYNAMNADISNLPTAFSGMEGNMDIEFVLAKRDPTGFATNGVTRHEYNQNTFTQNYIDNIIKPATTWDRTRYLNMWTVNDATVPGVGPVLGYASSIGGGEAPAVDGVVMDHNHFGRGTGSVNGVYKLGRTTTHEVGHWLGLFHTFQNSCAGNSAANCAFAGDRICDTPPTANANYGCNQSNTQNTCSETPTDLPDMWMNYMDYTDDACLYMFTQDQVTRMQATLASTRSYLQTSNGATVDTFTLSGSVKDGATLNTVANARVYIENDLFSFETITDTSGAFTLDFVPGEYAVYGGKWGYQTGLNNASLSLSSDLSNLSIIINEGYYEDFLFNNGWTNSGTASQDWERLRPVRSSYQSNIINPNADVDGDFGDKCMITKNGPCGASAFANDVDNGSSIISSPSMNLATYNNPIIRLAIWFANSGTAAAPPADDELLVKISDGTNEVTVAALTIDSITPFQWNEIEFLVSDYIPVSSNMNLIVEVADQGAEHLVEGGIDFMRVRDTTISGITAAEVSSISVYPNPTTSYINLNFDQDQFENYSIRLLNQVGKLVNTYDSIFAKRGTFQLALDQNLAKGIYYLELDSETNKQTFKIIIN